MHKLFLLIIIPTLLSCRNQPGENSSFTEEQISLLSLDSTKVLQTNNKKIETIDLNPFLKKQSFDFGSKIEELKLIPLETTNESIIGDVYKIIITDSIYYVFDDFKGGGLVIFDHHGKFIKRLNHGNGPGELFRLYDIAYDKSSDELIAYQHPYLVFYTSRGEFIQQKKLPFGFYNFMITTDEYIFKTIDNQGNDHLGLQKDNTLLITDKNFKLKYTGLPSLSNYTNYGGYSYLHRCGNTIQITQNYTDTIYHYSSVTNNLEAVYAMDYHHKRLPEHYLELNRQNFSKALTQNDFYYYIGEYLETKYHHVFFLRNEYVGLQTIVYRDKRNGHMIGGTNLDFDNNQIPAIGFPKDTFNEYFVSVYWPNKNNRFLSNSSIITEKDKQKINKLTEEDNPAIVLFKLKEL